MDCWGVVNLQASLFKFHYWLVYVTLLLCVAILLREPAGLRCIDFIVNSICISKFFGCFPPA